MYSADILFLASVFNNRTDRSNGFAFPPAGRSSSTVLIVPSDDLTSALGGEISLLTATVVLSELSTSD